MEQLILTSIQNNGNTAPQGLQGAEKLVITGTGFTSREEREALKGIVTQLGARYSPDLVHRSTSATCYTTHLVCRTLLDAFGTPKYCRAIEWGVPIVSCRWLTDCSHAQALLPLEAYKTDRLNSPWEILAKAAQPVSHQSRPMFSQKPIRTRPAAITSQGQTKSWPKQGQVAASRQALADRSNQGGPHAGQELPAKQPILTCSHSQESYGTSQLSLNCMLQPSHGATAAAVPHAMHGSASSLGAGEFSFQPHSGQNQGFGSQICVTLSQASTPGLGPPHAQGTTWSFAGWHAAMQEGQQQVPGREQQQQAPGTEKQQQQHNWMLQQEQAQDRRISMSPLPAGCEISSPSLGSMGMGMAATPTGAALAGTCRASSSVSRLPGRSMKVDDDFIIPGTQAPDEDEEDASSPQSLLTYLRNNMTLSGTRTHHHVAHDMASDLRASAGASTPSYPEANSADSRSCRTLRTEEELGTAVAEGTCRVQDGDGCVDMLVSPGCRLPPQSAKFSAASPEAPAHHGTGSPEAMDMSPAPQPLLHRSSRDGNDGELLHRRYSDAGTLRTCMHTASGDDGTGRLAQTDIPQPHPGLQALNMEVDSTPLPSSQSPGSSLGSAYGEGSSPLDRTAGHASRTGVEHQASMLYSGFGDDLLDAAGPGKLAACMRDGTIQATWNGSSSAGLPAVPQQQLPSTPSGMPGSNGAANAPGWDDEAPLPATPDAGCDSDECDDASREPFLGSNDQAPSRQQQHTGSGQSATGLPASALAAVTSVLPAFIPANGSLSTFTKALRHSMPTTTRAVTAGGPVLQPASHSAGPVLQPATHSGGVGGTKGVHPAPIRRHSLANSNGGAAQDSSSRRQGASPPLPYIKPDPDAPVEGSGQGSWGAATMGPPPTTLTMKAAMAGPSGRTASTEVAEASVSTSSRASGGVPPVLPAGLATAGRVPDVDTEDEEDWMEGCEEEAAPSFDLIAARPASSQQQQQQPASSQQQKQPLRRLQRGGGSVAKGSRPSVPALPSRTCDVGSVHDARLAVQATPGGTHDTAANPAAAQKLYVKAEEVLDFGAVGPLDHNPEGRPNGVKAGAAVAQMSQRGVMASAVMQPPSMSESAAAGGSLADCSATSSMSVAAKAVAAAKAARAAASSIRAAQSGVAPVPAAAAAGTATAATAPYSSTKTAAAAAAKAVAARSASTAAARPGCISKLPTQNIKSEPADASNTDQHDEGLDYFAAPGARPGLSHSTAAATASHPVHHLEQLLQQAAAAAASDAAPGSSRGLEAESAAAGQVQEVVVLKALSRPPKGSTVKEWHGLGSCKGVEFAEQVQLNPLGIIITCKERSKRTKCPLMIMRRPSGEEAAGDHTSVAQTAGHAAPGSCPMVQAMAVEAFAVYRRDGEWWVEYQQLLTAQDVQLQGRGSGQRISLPPDMLQGHEVLKALQQQHGRLADVCGEVEVLRTKKLPMRLAAATLYQRYVWDTATLQVLTDAPTSDFVIA